jgi:hypothetical protein
VLRWSWFIFNTSSSLVYNVRSRSKQLLLTSASLQQTKPGIVSRAMLSTTGTVPIKFQTPSRPQMFVVLLYKNELEGGKHSGTEGVSVSITTFKEKCVPYLFTYYFELRGIQVCECQGGWCWWLWEIRKVLQVSLPWRVGEWFCSHLWFIQLCPSS